MSTIERTIAHIRELARGTTVSPNMHIALLREIAKTHSEDNDKQSALSMPVLNDFLEQVQMAIYEKTALHEARRASATRNYGKSIPK
jgi:hypothetical protein